MKKNQKIGMGSFFGKNRNERQPDISDNLSGIENKDKSKARLISLGLSRIVDVKKYDKVC